MTTALDTLAAAARAATTARVTFDKADATLTDAVAVTRAYSPDPLPYETLYASALSAQRAAWQAYDDACAATAAARALAIEHGVDL